MKKNNLYVECTRFRVLQGKSKLVDEWMQFLNKNMEDVLLTLDGEKMYVETVFRETIDGNEYLYWYSVQGEGGIDVRDSESWVDIKHLEFWDRCIDEAYGHVDLITEVVMIPNIVKESMK